MTTIRGRLTMLVSAATAALLVLGGVGSIHAYFSDSTSRHASATAGTSVATVTSTLQRNPLTGDLGVDTVIAELRAAIIAGVPNGAPNGIQQQLDKKLAEARADIADALAHLNYYSYSSTVTNTGTTKWRGDLRIFDHFSSGASEQGVVFAFRSTDDLGTPQDVRKLVLSLIALDVATFKMPSYGTVDPAAILANLLSGYLIDRDTPATAAMPDGSAQPGQIAGKEADPALGGITLEPGESATQSYLVFVRAHELGEAPFPDLTVGTDLHATAMNGSTVTGWTADAWGAATRSVSVVRALLAQARLAASRQPDPAPAPTPAPEPSSPPPAEEPTEAPTEAPTEDPADTPMETPSESPSEAPAPTPPPEPSEPPTEEPQAEPSPAPAPAPEG